MTTTDSELHGLQPPPGRLWVLKRIAPYIRIAVLGFLPVPDLLGRLRMRKSARALVTLRTWPDMAATSEQAAQLAMLRLLWLQRQAHRAVASRQREAAAMLARASLETLFLGLYCNRAPAAIEHLHAGNLKALNAGLAYLGEIGIVPAEVIRDCTAALGVPADRYLGVREMAEAIDKANGDAGKSAQGIYSRLYGPLSNFTVHASGGTLMRHVRRNGRVRQRPSRSLARRSPARVADAAAGILAADLALRRGKPHEKLAAYAGKHQDRTLLPMAVMAFIGLGGSVRPRHLRETGRSLKGLFAYLWTGPASADPLDVRIAHVREQFAAALAIGDLDIPPGALDPFIDYMADKLACLAPAASAPTAEEGKGGAL